MSFRSSFVISALPDMKMSSSIESSRAFPYAFEYSARAACMQACIGCGRCTKECQYDAIKVENGYAHIDPAKCTRCGACAQVCPCKCITIA